MIGVSFLLLLLGLDGRIGRLDGLLLFAGIVVYTVFAVRQSRKESKPVEAEYDHEYGQDRRMGLWRILRNVGLVIVGLLLLVVGARWLVDGAVSIARALAVERASHRPDHRCSRHVTARSRHLGHRQPAWRAGHCCGQRRRQQPVQHPGGAGRLGRSGADGVNVPPAALQFDIPFMIAVAVACLPIFFTGYRIARWEGAIFLAYYVAYTHLRDPRCRHARCVAGLQHRAARVRRAIDRGDAGSVIGASLAQSTSPAGLLSGVISPLSTI